MMKSICGPLRTTSNQLFIVYVHLCFRQSQLRLVAVLSGVSFEKYHRPKFLVVVGVVALIRQWWWWIFLFIKLLTNSLSITMIFVFGRINYGWLQRSAVIDCNVSTRFLPATIFVSCQLMVFFWTFSWFSMKNKHTATKITNYTTTNSSPFMSKIQLSTINDK